MFEDRVYRNGGASIAGEVVSVDLGAGQSLFLLFPAQSGPRSLHTLANLPVEAFPRRETPPLAWARQLAHDHPRADIATAQSPIAGPDGSAIPCTKLRATPGYGAFKR